ncbi:kinase-like domain-containing protein [Lentinula lateritia]|uniref:Kinase-like domain-containing protein n=1 Tax=Lentinula lateritia TaxID=40482 RepID=A0ABQ8V156_9AGAR|nr:kinase-like domain-containing protein [Lentinula lateritia]
MVVHTLWKLGNFLARRNRLISTTATRHFEPENFYAYTSGRWIHDETRQLSLRYRSFNVDALKTVVAHAAGGNSVLKMEKLAEGSYNKVFVLTLDNGQELIARILTVLAGPGKLVTASEVATMDYARSLGVPVPRVLAWCADASSTPVQSEYIIMEKASGVELGRVWDQMSSDQKDDTVREVVNIEKRMIKPFFKAYGSVFYQGDVDSGVVHDRFVVGPNVSLPFWDEERRHMDIDRGPWTDPLSYLKAISSRERIWIHNHATSNPHPTLFEPPTHIQDQQAHISLLNRYDAVLPYIIPTQDPILLRPTLWHTDLHFGNIFLSQDDLAEGNVRITAIIDWQHACVLPLYLQARAPRFLPLPDQIPPSSDDDDDEEEEEAFDQQAAAAAALADAELANRHELYHTTTASLNPDYHHALSFNTRDLIITPVQFSGRTWSGGYVPLQNTLLRIVDNWDYLGHRHFPCPIAFSQSEREAHAEDAQEWQVGEDLQVMIQDRIGVQEGGWVSHEGYEDALRRNEELKEEFLQQKPHGKDKDTFLRAWPYRPVV